MPYLPELLSTCPLKIHCISSVPEISPARMHSSRTKPLSSKLTVFLLGYRTTEIESRKVKCSYVCVANLYFYNIQPT